MMKLKIVVLMFILLCFQTDTLRAQETFISVLNSRGNLQNLAWKIKDIKHDTLTIAFIGGSITEAKDGWRDQTMDWFHQQYPQKRIKQINAGIGGTGSSLGVYRIDEQVLQYQPDLVFIEFAVNDYKETKKSILESMEGMVRKIWLQNPKTDICFIYTFTKDMMENYQKGFPPYSLLTMEEIANHYQIPSVNFAPDILKRLKDKNLFIIGSKPAVNDSLFFSGDGVHPYPETGHKYYAQTLTESLPILFSSPKPKKHKLPPVYFSDAFVNAKMVDIEANMLLTQTTHPNKTIDENTDVYKKLLPNIKVLASQQTSLSFSFLGNKIGFLDVIGPSSTQLKVEIDNDPPRYITRFDRFCTFTRVHWFFVENLSEGQHHIKISIVPHQIDKFQIIGKKPSEVKSPEDYEQEFWQVGKILLMNLTNKKYK